MKKKQFLLLLQHRWTLHLRHLVIGVAVLHSLQRLLSPKTTLKDLSEICTSLINAKKHCLGIPMIPLSFLFLHLLVDLSFFEMK